MQLDLSGLLINRSMYRDLLDRISVFGVGYDVPGVALVCLATVVLNTKDYNEKVSALHSASTYRRLPKESTEAVERKTTLHLKKSSLPEEVVQQLRPQGSKSPKL
jgi:homoserine kinase